MCRVLHAGWLRIVLTRRRPFSCPAQPVGCTTRSGVKVEQATLRGVESYGMLCSAHECGWVAEPGGACCFTD